MFVCVQVCAERDVTIEQDSLGPVDAYIQPHCSACDPNLNLCAWAQTGMLLAARLLCTSNLVVRQQCTCASWLHQREPEGPAHLQTYISVETQANKQHLMGAALSTW